MKKEKKINILKAVIIAILFIALCFLSIAGPHLFALGFDPGDTATFEGPDSLFLTATKSAITVYNDPGSSSRSIAVFSYTFPSSYSYYTLTFDTAIYSGGGSPAVRLDTQSTTSFWTINGFTSLYIDGTNDINDNLLFYDFPFVGSSSTVYLYISIDKNVDTNYINNQGLIANSVLFSALSPYQFVSGISDLSPEEYQASILTARLSGYQDGYDDGVEDGIIQGYTDANMDYNSGYAVGLEDGEDVGYQDGYDVGYSDGVGGEDVGGFFGMVIGFIGTIFTLQIMPGLTIAGIISIMVGFWFLPWFLKQIRG